MATDLEQGFWDLGLKSPGKPIVVEEQRRGYPDEVEREGKGGTRVGVAAEHGGAGRGPRAGPGAITEVARRQVGMRQGWRVGPAPGSPPPDSALGGANLATGSRISTRTSMAVAFSGKGRWERSKSLFYSWSPSTPTRIWRLELVASGEDGDDAIEQPEEGNLAARRQHLRKSKKGY